MNVTRYTLEELRARALAALPQLLAIESGRRDSPRPRDPDELRVLLTLLKADWERSLASGRVRILEDGRLAFRLGTGTP